MAAYYVASFESPPFFGVVAHVGVHDVRFHEGEQGLEGPEEPIVSGHHMLDAAHDVPPTEVAVGANVDDEHALRRLLCHGTRRTRPRQRKS